MISVPFPAAISILATSSAFMPETESPSYTFISNCISSCVVLNHSACFCTSGISPIVPTVSVVFPPVLLSFPHPDSTPILPNRHRPYAAFFHIFIFFISYSLFYHPYLSHPSVLFYSWQIKKMSHLFIIQIRNCHSPIR